MPAESTAIARAAAAADEQPPLEPTDSLSVLLQHLKQARGFDFTGYKRSSIERRVAKQMETVGVADHAAYVEYLEVHPEEYARLFDLLLINVTAFFRDKPAWDFLTRETLPRLLARKGTEAPLRVWCSGCASGEEAYTIAIAIAETMGIDAFLRRVKIYATDADDGALATARAGIYTPKQADGVSEPLLERYFERVDQRFSFRRDLRRAIVFGRNDLLQDAPISRVDLLICRNTLMYFNAETQAKVVGRFNFALEDDGFLFLGRSEMLITHTDLFTPVNLKQRVFTKVVKGSLRDRLLTAARTHDVPDGPIESAIRMSSFDAGPLAQITIDDDGLLVLANTRARELFGLDFEDVGRPLKDLGVAYRPLELRAGIEQALAERRELSLGPASWTAAGGETVELEAQIVPLVAGELALGASIAYWDVTRLERQRVEVETARRELDAAFEELQSTVEELETTNEELQSTNEELETSNEELQSTVEDLNASNDDLETTNDELHQRTVELNEVNASLETILTSLGVAMVVVNHEIEVEVWNAHAEELWGLRRDEVLGQGFLALDIGLPLDTLEQSIGGALRDADFRARLTLPATTRHDPPFTCDVTCLPLTLHDRQIGGAILLVERRRNGAVPD